METGKLNIDATNCINELKFFLKNYEIRKKEYMLFFRGKSFDFETFREYSSDDDASSIDWIASARSNKYLVRQYQETEKHTVIFLIDVSQNMVLGSEKKLKCERAAEIALALAYLILEMDNRAGFIFYNDKINFLPPAKGKKCFSAALDALSDPKNYEGFSDVKNAFHFMDSLPKYPSSSLIWISDFLRFDKVVEKDLVSLTSRFECISFIVKDPLDMQLPKISGEFVVEDPESKQQILLDPSVAQNYYKMHSLEQERFVKKSLRKRGIDFLKIPANGEFIPAVAEFMSSRIKYRGGFAK